MQKTLSVINLTSIRKNAQYVRVFLKDKFFFAVVKADAYGHGAPEVALAIEDIADGFCVAITDEAVALRLAGITKPILVFTPPLGEDDISRARLYNLWVTVNSVSTAQSVKDLPCHIKINTGMNRYGCSLSELENILKVLKKDQILGVYSHAYAPSDREATLAQLKIFDAAERAVKSKNPNALAHFSSSAGILSQTGIKDGARAGILLYGYPPAGFEKFAHVTPALKVYARMVQQTPFAGGGVGYGKAVKDYSRLSAYRVGYADGFLRSCGAGEGNLCMDAMISTRGEKLLPVFTDAAKYAEENGTITYEALCSVTRRSERIYEQDRFTL